MSVETRTNRDADAEVAEVAEVAEATQASEVWPSLWRSGPVLVCAVVAVVALVVGGILAGMGVQQHRTETARAEALQAGVAAAQELLSYDHTSLDRAVDQRMDLLTGDFRDRYRAMVQDSVAPVAKARQVVTTSTVVGSSVVGDDGPDEVTLLLFLNQSSEAPALAQPLLTGSRVVMTLQHVDGRWLTAGVDPV
ncbi:hypothetical protein [Pseudonocardia sp. NPDC049154]|uniref:hypothetical protein n=1 Tax=Pseudonocardia sp. NPDC049154 TaxID=3155501 RepID=UPI00340F5F3E